VSTAAARCHNGPGISAGRRSNKRQRMRSAVMPSTVSPKLLCSANTCNLSLPVGRSPMFRPTIASPTIIRKVSQCSAMLKRPQ
jgi:hypothetical protein